MRNYIFQQTTCNDTDTIVSLYQEPTNLDNEINAHSTVAKHRDITTKSGCTATLYFSDHENPQIRWEVAELLLRSVEKRSEAT